MLFMSLRYLFYFVIQRKLKRMNMGWCWKTFRSCFIIFHFYIIKRLRYLKWLQMYLNISQLFSKYFDFQSNPIPLNGISVFLYKCVAHQWFEFLFVTFLYMYVLFWIELNTYTATGAFERGRLPLYIKVVCCNHSACLYDD